MKIKYEETIEFIKNTKNTGLVLIKNSAPQYYLDSLKKYFGGFGRNLVICGNDEYLILLFVPEIMNRLDSYSYYEKENEFLFIEGTFYDNNFHLKNNDAQIDTHIAKRLYDELKVKCDYSSLKNINGHYSGVAFTNNRLIAFNDRFGVNKLFCYNKKDKFILTNNLFSIINNKKLNIEIDDEAIAQILTSEYPFERKTGFKDVNYILPSDILIKNNDKIEFLKNYIMINRSKVENNKVHIEELYNVFDDFFIKLKRVIDEPLNLFLSKGKDSRLFIEFLEKNNISYNLYTFLQSTGIFDYSYAIEIAKLLNKDIHLLEHYQIDELTEIITSMSTTVTSPWLALAFIIKKNILNYGIIGTFGSSLSGNLTTFRHFPKIKNKSQLIQAEFGNYCKGVTSEDIVATLPYFAKYNVKDSFIKSYSHYNELTLYDTELLYKIDYRFSRNTFPILNKTTHFITTIHPYVDKYISQKYLSLPLELIKSQKAHAIISSKNIKSNKIKSTTFPVSLRNEKYFREIMMIAIKINSMLKGKILAKKLDKIAPIYDSLKFYAKSKYFSDIFDNSPIECQNKRLLSRLKNVDNFIKNTYETHIDDICHKIDKVEVIGKNTACIKFKETFLKANGWGDN